MMMKILSLSVASLILVQSFNIHLMDALKLSNLMEHVAFHKETYNDGVFSFIAKHYGNQVAEHQVEHENDHDDEKNKDENHHQLPFDHGVCLDATPIYVFNLNVYSLEEPVVHVHGAKNFYHQDSYSYLENSDIFQPPKVA